MQDSTLVQCLLCGVTFYLLFLVVEIVLQLLFLVAMLVFCFFSCFWCCSTPSSFCYRVLRQLLVFVVSVLSNLEYILKCLQYFFSVTYPLLDSSCYASHFEMVYRIPDRPKYKNLYRTNSREMRG